MNELDVDTAISGELLDTDPDCSLAYQRCCTNRDVKLVEDPYEAEVNNTPGQLILACDACLG
jgi:hypothetical protein